MRWRVVLRVEGPLLVGSGPAAQMVQLGRDFVPGSTWRGALADAVLRHFGVKAPGAAGAKGWPEFEAAFGADVRFGFLYPGPGPAWESFPLPLTVYSCKAAPGLAAREPEGGSAGHGLRDMLLARLRRFAGVGGRGTWRCWCGERLERRRGLAARKAGSDGDGPVYREVKVARRLMVRVGLDRRTETAAEGILYALDAAVPGPDGILCFTGSWWGDRERLEALQDLLKAACPPAGEGRAVRLGTARARGLGRAGIEIRAVGTRPLPPPEERLEAFQPRRPSGELADPRHLYFSLTLRSPLLVRDRSGAACGRPVRALREPEAENLRAGRVFLREGSGVEGGW
ncbi:MAG: RAMP superfamily CRISPR-associated protein, partial [Desulfotomaculales bacterium]